MQFVILGLLMIAPMSLYDLHKQFAAGPSLFYSASFGSLQRALRQLIAQGWATVTDASSSGRPRNLHAPTAEGIAAWREWMREHLGDAARWAGEMGVGRRPQSAAVRKAALPRASRRSRR